MTALTQHNVSRAADESEARRAHSLSGGAPSFVRALWGLDVSVEPLPEEGDRARLRPRYLGSRLWLPATAVASPPGALSSYRLAAAAHAAAHMVFGAARFHVGRLKPAQVAIISLLEDARVEHLASAQYPGLFKLWAPYYDARASGAKTSSALLARLARALHDDSYIDDDGWVRKARASFFADRRAWHDPDFVRSLGGRLGNDLGQMRVQFNARDYVVQPAYRDDNVGLWLFEQDSAANGSELSLYDLRRSEQPSPLDDGPRKGDARRKDDAPPKSVPQSTNVDQIPAEGSPLAARVDQREASAVPIRYPEWDYVIRRERPAFCSVWENQPATADVAPLDAALTRYAPARRLLRRSALRLTEQRPVRLRRLSDGDRLDWPAALAVFIARASGTRIDPRIYGRIRCQLEPPALLLLLDCSESLNDVPSGGSSSVLEHARCASALLAATVHDAAPDWAIHGFSSNGRGDVRYARFKDFDERYDERVRARLAGMTAGFSTRLGAALRHAGQALKARRARRKWLLLVSDGEPSDVDVHDPKYLLFDAKRATQQNDAIGVKSFCVGLDPQRENSLRCIFGRRNYLLTNRTEQLPAVLAELYLRLAR